MVRYNIGRYIAAIVVISVVSFLFISFYRNNLKLNLNNIWEDITTTITIVGLFCTLFVSWAWKYKLFQGWLVPFPCLSGEWEGEILSTYEVNTAPIPMKVVIKHDFFNIQIRIQTNESASISTCGCFDIDEDRGLKQLFYSYQNNPKARVRDRSEIHYGTTRLEISDNAESMEGEYWTSRKTTGDITLTRIKN